MLGAPPFLVLTMRMSVTETSAGPAGARTLPPASTPISAPSSPSVWARLASPSRMHIYIFRLLKPFANAMVVKSHAGRMGPVWDTSIAKGRPGQTPGFGPNGPEQANPHVSTSPPTRRVLLAKSERLMLVYSKSPKDRFMSRLNWRVLDS